MKYLFIICTIISLPLGAQTAIKNSGNFKIHQAGKIGFHTHLINDTGMDNNIGMVGFYGETALQIKGNHPPQFRLVELANTEGLILHNSLYISSLFSFYYGNVFTPYGDANIALHFLKDATYEGVSDKHKVLGYAGTETPNFVLPIGNEDKLRTLNGNFEESMYNFRAAYFDEDPNEATIFEEEISTSSVDHPIMTIGTEEFWDIDGEKETTITLSWDMNSEIGKLTANSLARLFIAAWNTEKKVWENIGNTGTTGNLEAGTISSLAIIPDQYTAFTFGSVGNVLGLGNYLLTPNGDGTNEKFVIRGVQNMENNTLKIYNRWGRIVYEKRNYYNDFDGKSNLKEFQKNNLHLPSGIYVYTLELHSVDQIHQGFLYLNH